MKKILALVLSIAMVLMMTVSAFAIVDKPESPDDVDGWTAYYTDLIANAEENGQNVTDILGEITNDIKLGAVSAGTMATVIANIAGSELGENEQVAQLLETAKVVVDYIQTGELPEGVELPSLPDISLPDVSLPEGSLPDVSLPEQLPDIGGGDSEGGSFLDTIFGAIGGLIDMIFGGGSTDDPSTPSDDGNGDDDGSDPWGSGDDGNAFNDNSLGDTSVIAIASVAVIAGAALVLTRKKHSDDE